MPHLLGALACAALAACGSDDPAARLQSTVPGFTGLVVADEPQAALIGRDVLTSGGTAADAAVAMYFAMAVTLPSQASLGGGGACVTYERVTNRVAALDFLARPPAVVPQEADRPTAVPGSVRGLYALHALYGRLHWAQLLAPAEGLARFGAPVSRALARDLEEVGDALVAEPQVRRLFGTPGGKLVSEGDKLLQPDLAEVIARIRASGANEFYTGALAERLVTAIRAAGGSLAAEDLATYEPSWTQALSVSFDDQRAYFMSPPPAGGVIAGQIWAMLARGDHYRGTAEDLRDAVLADAAERAFADQQTPGAGSGDVQERLSSAHIDELLGSTTSSDVLPAQPVTAHGPLKENPAAASFVAVDGYGSTVACSVTLNSLFGTGRLASGIVLAALPGSGGRGAAMLGPMIVLQPRGRQLVWAGAAAGGVAAPTALVDVAARTLLARQPLSTAMAAPRMHSGSDPGFVFAEPGASAASLQALLNRGAEAVVVERLGRVNAVVCPDGLQSAPDSCVAATDPRGLGLAASTQ